MDHPIAADSASRFEAYVEGLVSVIGHADRARPLRDYCVGLMMPCERKSVEPMAAVTAPERTAAQHQSLLHFVGAFGLVAHHQDGFPQTGPAFGRSGTAVLWSTRQAEQLSGRGVAIDCQSSRQPAGGVSPVFAGTVGGG